MAYTQAYPMINSTQMFSQLPNSYDMLFSPIPSNSTYGSNTYCQQPQCPTDPVVSQEFSYFPPPADNPVPSQPITHPVTSSSSFPSPTSNSELSSSDPSFISVQGILPPTKNEAGRFECQLCDRSYTHAKHLKRHMMRHTGQKPYACSWCTARFTRPDIRKRHVSKCKVRRKMEGLDSIKIEEEDPAKAISLKNKKLKAKKAAKENAAAATEQHKTTHQQKQQLNSIEVIEQKFLNIDNTHITNQDDLSQFQQGVMAQVEEIIPSPPLLERHVLSSPVQNIAFIPTPPSIHSPLEFKNVPYDQQLVFKGMQIPQPPQSSLSSIGYMTPEEPAHMIADTSNCYFYYNEQQQQQQFLGEDYFYSYSPLETFIPPVYQ